jgi:GNAT superfamily N-acetyltransferase
LSGNRLFFMLKVKPMRQGDFAFATRLANTADWNMSVEDFDFNVKLEPEGCFIAYQGEKRLGIATCISYGKIGWFGNLIVEKQFRREGVGSLLLKHALDYLRGRGVESIGLYAVRDLADFYGRFGFKKDIEFTVLHHEKLTLTSHVKLSPVLPQDIQNVADFDAACFGASREKLLSAIISKPNNFCYCSVENGEIEGFVAAKVFENMAEVGPLVCKDKALAKMLLEAALNRLKGLYVTLCLPKQSSLITYLGELGFEEEFSLSRMFLGSASAKDCLQIAESLERG